MATGFGKGWLHGMLLGGAGLVVLSLAMPLPEGAVGDATVGLAPALDVPAGSQFARGEDMAPVAPAVSEGPQANAGAVPVIAAPSEAMPLPSVVSDTPTRPDPAGDAPVALPQQAELPEAPAVAVQVADDPVPALLPPELRVDGISRIIEPPLIPYALPEAPDSVAVSAEGMATTNPSLTAAQADMPVEVETETDTEAASLPEPVSSPTAFDPSTLPDLRELMQGL
ncbi:MAG: hypothetical protein Q4G24_04010 [Paracoccus sp. (in: a-proteobacteria)]|uniref:hypothetical protein n=1 Tax=Paracoccus sp. TaxID=267 RepID=UPI0026DF9B49|nr:hypothetical protein [Paracoccus sp. (in: a-proteobacteria)]MDO5620615.1 hypothetical protein [Paracoccus sp. (in: a-proteobacteria)]